MKKNTISILFLLFFLNINAQINFLNNDVLTDANKCIGSISQAIAIDMDNDGDIDVISASGSENKIVWQENLNGFGTFGEIKVITDQVNQVKYIETKDIDNDSDLDLISISSVDGKIAWYENLGNGNFGTQNVIASNLFNAKTASIGDIDGDGDMDIVANTGNTTIAWFKNLDGQGTFSSSIVISSSNLGTTSLDVKDADGDNDNDIVASSTLTDQYIKVVLYTNINGLGSFGPQQVLNTSPAQINYSITSKVYFYDLDNDLDNDILFFSNNKLSWLVNTNGLGSFNTTNVIYQFYTSDRFLNIDFCDMDNDGDKDIVSHIRMWQQPQRIVWFPNNNSSVNNYNGYQLIFDLTSNEMTSFKICDIDNDGSKDILSSQTSGNKLVWHKSYSTMKTISYACHPQDAKTVDLDNDNDLDIASLDTEEVKFVFYKNIDGQGTMSPQSSPIVNALIGFNYIFSDVNEDGYKDLVSGNGWYGNNGQGSFNNYVTFDYSSPYGNRIFEADINNDGKMDLLIARQLSNDLNVIGWYRNTGLGNFAQFEVIFNTSNTQTIYKLDFVDMDGDTFKDIVFSGHKIGIIKNLDGLGNFSDSIQYVYNYPAPDVYCVDLDGDGDKDILVDNHENGSSITLNWYKNNGTNFFLQSQSIYSGGYLYGIRPVDLDNDGDLDLIAFKDNGEYWIENLNGLGSFNTVMKKLVDHPYYNTSREIADVDNDGKLDILSSTSQANRPLYWYKNDGLAFNKISGVVRLDNNNDNVCNTSDNLMQNVKIVSENDTDSFTTYTIANGYYQLYVPIDNQYTTSIGSNLPNYFSANPSQYVTNFVGGNNLQTLNFCVQPNQVVNDLEVSIYPVSEARPGFVANYVISYHNKGTTQLSGNVKLQFDSTKMSFLSSIPTLNSQIASELTYNITNLKPFETKLVKINFQIFAPPVVNIDDILNFTATINPITGDITPNDNVASLSQVVIGSYDPNDILVSEGDSILEEEIDDYLHYTIRFQNTGTASAINVVVKNSLDEGLDWETFEIDGFSHNGYVEIINDNQISFVFKNIYLPSNIVNESGSQGFICYKIKPKSTSVIGDVFDNNADIYFDYNPPIYTNTVSTEIINNLSVDDFERNSVKLYPNPTKGLINIQSNFEISKITVVNIYGQEIIVQDDPSQVLDISSLNTGIYFVQIKDELGKLLTQKIIKN